MTRTGFARLSAIALVASAIGCRTASNAPPCTSPLLPDTTAAENKPTTPVPPAPEPIRVPVDVLAKGEARPAKGPTPAIAVPVLPVPTTEPLAQAGSLELPKIESRPQPVIPPDQLPRITNGPRPTDLHGHAPDYAWLIGTLDWHAKGKYWMLRYAEAGADDRWGGKVRVMDEAVLKGYQSGDVVRVEGELLAPATAVAPTQASYPPYRATRATLVDKAR